MRLDEFTSNEALFAVADAYNGDPMRPDLIQPTPVSIITHLTKPDRELRVTRLIQQAHDIYDNGLADHLDGHELVASDLLFSGGNDSTLLGHVFKDRVTHIVHINTGIGIKATRDYVHETAALWNLPLIEKTPRKGMTYRDLVLGRVMARSRETGEMVQAWAGGFPGPAGHAFYYQRLKERQLESVRRAQVTDPRKQRVVFVAGRRRQESARRAMVLNKQPAVPLSERRGSTIWVSPIAFWTDLDMNTYRLMNDVPRNTVSDTLHMSGECLCGAFAHRGELDEIGYWFPEMKAEIEALEGEVRAAGVAPERYCTWGHGLGKPSKSGPMCSSCDSRFIDGQMDILEAIS